MKLHATLSLCTIAGLCALSQPAQAQTQPAWHRDQALEFNFAQGARSDRRSLTTRIPVTVTNRSSVDSTGPHRVLVRSFFPIFNAQGFDAQSGAYILNLCGNQDTCSVPAGESVQAEITWPYLGFVTSYFLQLLPPSGIAQNVPFQLNLLHNADMDGASGALEHVKPFSALVNGLRAQYPENTLLLSSGDNYIPGPRFAASADPSLNSVLGLAGEGRADISFMNAMDYQASAVGNHDLDGGPASFLSIIAPQQSEDGNYPGASFPYLSANLDFSPEPDFADRIAINGETPAQMAGKVGNYTITTVKGQRIGIVGATTPNLSNITNTGDIAIAPENAADLDALAQEIQASVDAITAQGVNKVIVLAHMQSIAIEKALAPKLRDVDIIVAGGSNTLLADANDTLLEGDNAADTYPLELVSASQEPILIVNTDGDYKYLGRLLSSFDLSGTLLTNRLDDQINGAYASTQSVLDTLGNPAPNPKVVQIADEVSAILAERDGNILGKSTVYLDGRRGQVRSQETNLGNLTADANLWVAKQFDSSVSISLKNGGGIRDDIGYFSFPPGSTNASDLEFFPTAPNPAAGKASGDISQFDVQGTLRFNNGLTLITVTAADLAAIINHGVANAGEGVTSGRFPQVAGIKFSWDPSLPEDSDRVKSLAVLDDQGNVADVVIRDGALVGDAQRTFRMVTLDFLYNRCGDGYPLPGCGDSEASPVPETVPATPVYLQDVGLADGASTFEVAGSEQDALAEYLLSQHATPETAYATSESDAAQDERIQNLSLRTDTVLPSDG